jgi:hypothetical protein
VLLNKPQINKETEIGVGNHLNCTEFFFENLNVRTGTSVLEWCAVTFCLAIDMLSCVHWSADVCITNLGCVLIYLYCVINVCKTIILPVIMYGCQTWFSHYHFKAQWLLYVPPGLTFTKSTFCSHSVFLCFVWISEQTAIISLYNIN